ncbi:CidA/LrgA family protein [Bacteroides fragilis]|nr:CidA/LrgA family protein [Bacteroides fragilis]
MIRQCAILFGCLALGELIVYLTGIKLPSSIIGMLLLTLFLKLGWIKLHWVQGMSDFLVANLGFFFIPPGSSPDVIFRHHCGTVLADCDSYSSQYPSCACHHRMGPSINT